MSHQRNIAWHGFGSEWLSKNGATHVIFCNTQMEKSTINANFPYIVILNYQRVTLVRHDFRSNSQHPTAIFLGRLLHTKIPRLGSVVKQGLLTHSIQASYKNCWIWQDHARCNPSSGMLLSPHANGPIGIPPPIPDTMQRKEIAG